MENVGKIIYCWRSALLLPTTVQQQFVQIIRAVESSLGVNSMIGPDTHLDIDLSLNFTSSLCTLCRSESRGHKCFACRFHEDGR
jgi:hypothetical protein